MKNLGVLALTISFVIMTGCSHSNNQQTQSTQKSTQQVNSIPSQQNQTVSSKDNEGNITQQAPVKPVLTKQEWVSFYVDGIVYLLNIDEAMKGKIELIKMSQLKNSISEQVKNKLKKQYTKDGIIIPDIYKISENGRYLLFDMENNNQYLIYDILNKKLIDSNEISNKDLLDLKANVYFDTTKADPQPAYFFDPIIGKSISLSLNNVYKEYPNNIFANGPLSPDYRYTTLDIILPSNQIKIFIYDMKENKIVDSFITVKDEALENSNGSLT